MAFGLVVNLEAAGYDVTVAETGEEALKYHSSFRPELILLDLKLPDIDGLEILRRIRDADPLVRVVIVSCLDQPEQRADGFRAGADDYQIKPFALLELLARVQKQLENERDRRQTITLPYDPQQLVLDSVNGAVHFRSRIIELSNKPFALLTRLVEARGACVSKEEILRDVWQFQNLPHTHTIEQHITHLRQVLRTDPSAPEVIQTVHGRGYRINADILS